MRSAFETAAQTRLTSLANAPKLNRHWTSNDQCLPLRSRLDPLMPQGHFMELPTEETYDPQAFDSHHKPKKPHPQEAAPAAPAAPAALAATKEQKEALPPRSLGGVHAVQDKAKTIAEAKLTGVAAAEIKLAEIERKMSALETKMVTGVEETTGSSATVVGAAVAVVVALIAIAIWAVGSMKVQIKKNKASGNLAV
jgi:hypothetical protein